jgi:hypothetical protein
MRSEKPRSPRRGDIARYFAHVAQRPPEPPAELPDVNTDDVARRDAAVVRFVMGVGR